MENDPKDSKRHEKALATIMSRDAPLAMLKRLVRRRLLIKWVFFHSNDAQARV